MGQDRTRQGETKNSKNCPTQIARPDLSHTWEKSRKEDFTLNISKNYKLIPYKRKSKTYFPFLFLLFPLLPLSILLAASGWNPLESSTNRRHVRVPQKSAARASQSITPASASGTNQVNCDLRNCLFRCLAAVDCSVVCSCQVFVQDMGCCSSNCCWA